MKVIGLDNKKYTWNFTKHKQINTNCSDLHWRARKLLWTLFPFDIIYEEVTIPGIKSEITHKSLIADFYIHTYRLMIEVQGEQHYKFSQFFHNNQLMFFRAQKLDKLKYKWCKLNKIHLIELPYNKTDDEWLVIIRNEQ